MFKINCEKVTEAGEKCKAKAEQLQGIMSSLNSLEQEIAEVWQHSDSYNFLLSFNKHNQELTYIIAFLKNHADLFKKSAEAHDQIDQDYGNAMSG